MKIILDKPYEKDEPEIFLDYYNYNQENNGPSLNSKVTDVLIRNELDHELMFNYNVNYAAAYNTVQNLYNDPETIFFGVYSDDEELIAHTKCEIAKIGEDKWQAYISDIIVHNEASLRLLKEGKAELNNIYLFLVKTIEKYINDHCPIVDDIVYENPTNDLLQNVLEVKAYKEDGLFEDSYIKKTRKREMFNARRNSSK